MSPKAAALMIRIVGGVSIVTALLFAFVGVSDFTGANEIFFQIASSGGNGVEGFNTPEAKLGMAIAGGVFGGFMAMYLFVTAPGIEQGNELIRKGTIYAFLTWFAIDSSASVATGNTMNVLPNVVFLALYLAPLILVKRTT